MRYTLYRYNKEGRYLITDTETCTETLWRPTIVALLGSSFPDKLGDGPGRILICEFNNLKTFIKDHPEYFI